MIATFAEHPITRASRHVAVHRGRGTRQADRPCGIEVLGWLDTGEAVMGVVAHPKARIFFLGDTNGLEEVPQPLVDNLIAWGFE